MGLRRARRPRRAAFPRPIARGISPPRWRVTFWTARKSPKSRQGGAPDGRSASIFAHPLDPHLRESPLEVGKTLPARKIRSAWVRFFLGPQGPWGIKNFNCCGSTTAPEFAEPTRPVQIAFPLQGGRWHGEAVTDEGGFLKRAPNWFPVDCRGGYQPPKSLPLGPARLT